MKIAPGQISLLSAPREVGNALPWETRKKISSTKIESRSESYKNWLDLCKRTYQSGKTIDQVAKRAGSNPSTVYYALIRNGFKLRGVEEARQITLSARNEAIAASFDFGLSVKEVAERFDLSITSVRRILRKSGRRTPGMGEHCKKPELAAKYWEFYSKGWSCPKIAKHFGVAQSGVNNILRKYGYQLRGHNGKPQCGD